MMHFQVPVTFKLNPYAGIYHEGVGKSRAIDLELGPLLQMLLGFISDARLPFVKYQNFTLINMYLCDSDADIGYSTVPPDATMFPASALVLTFCLTSKPAKSFAGLQPVFSQGKITRTKIWSCNSQQYLTVSLPKLDLDRFGLRNIRIESLYNLHNQIGCVTKNFVSIERTSVLKPKDFAQEVDTLAYQLMNKYATMQGLANNVGLMSWPYAKCFWSTYSNTFIEDTVPESFPLYWCIYLNSRVYSMDMSVGAQAYVQQRVVDFVAKGLTQLQVCLGSTLQPYEIKDELIAFLAITLEGYIKDTFEGLSRSSLQVMSGTYLGKILYAAQQVPEYKQELYMALTGMGTRPLASSLLDGALSSSPAAKLLDLLRGAAGETP
jgi:hypothetical protein